jgi:hypothetical protein
MKIATKIFSLFLLLLVLNLGCSKTPTEFPTSISSGKYNYQAYNHNNDLVASGYFTISISDSLISGNKNIQDTGSEHQPESGEGEIRGRIIGSDRIVIYLYETGGPYLVIKGNYQDGIINGERRFASETGVWVEILGKFRSEFLE